MKKILLIIILIIMTGCKQNVEGYIIKLYSNPSTGYSWEYTLSDENIIEVSYIYDDSNCAKNIVGCGGQNIYTIKPLKPGKVKLELVYKSVNNDKIEATYEITVNEDMSITETHYGKYFESRE